MRRAAGKARVCATQPLGAPSAAWCLAGAVMLGACGSPEIPAAGGFREKIAVAEGPRAPWGKAVGDIDGDGWPDLVVGGHEEEKPALWRRLLGRVGGDAAGPARWKLAWYRNPDWDETPIAFSDPIRTDIETADVDGDGKLDVLAVTDNGLRWYRNPDWKSVTLAEGLWHDVEAADLDGDGDVDLVLRNQSRFGYDDGNRLRLLRQDGEGRWAPFTVDIAPGEGLKVSDMNADGYPDILVSREWLENPGSRDFSLSWKRHAYPETWDWDDVFLEAADIDGDGRVDVVASPAEPAGETYRLSWFRAPDGGEGWEEVIIDSVVETDHHALTARDFDGDGRPDVATGELNQGNDPDDVSVYLNSDRGRRWQRRLLSREGVHSFRAEDLDRDGDVDLFGTHWQLPDGYWGPYPVRVWDNLSSQTPLWEKRVLDAARPGQATAVLAVDLDGDGHPDAVSGGRWYRNPGKRGGDWEILELGIGALDAVAAGDFDGDGHADIVVSGWRGYNQSPGKLARLKAKIFSGESGGGASPWTTGSDLRLGRGDGRGAFTWKPLPTGAQGDFVQGCAQLRFKGRDWLVLSFHEAGRGVQGFAWPDSAHPLGHWELLWPDSQDEALSVGDPDGDGDEDLLLGTVWLRNEGDSALSVQHLPGPSGKPDRNAWADLDGDGDLDAVVGFEAIGKPGDLLWFENPGSQGGAWRRHLVARPLGPMSLSVVDMDGDGDRDIAVGEHLTAHPQNARLLWYENVSGNGHAWALRVIGRGDEHHDGALAFDADGDGGMDLLSVGWTHGKVLLYLNPGKP